MRAAQTMGDLHVRVIPVCDGERLVGIVTDRDIVLRGVAEGCAVEETPLSEVMSKDARWCFEDQPVGEVVEAMRAAQIRRVPVVDRDRHLVGMLSLGEPGAADGAAEENAANRRSEAVAEIAPWRRATERRIPATTTAERQAP